MYKDKNGKSYNIIKNPWIRYVAHKLRVLDINLSTMYYDEIGHKPGVRCMTDPETTRNNAEEAAMEVYQMMDLIVSNHLIKGWKYNSSPPEVHHLRTSGSCVPFPVTDGERVKDRVKKSKRKRKYNWRKHLKSDKLPFQDV